MRLIFNVNFDLNRYHGMKYNSIRNRKNLFSMKLKIYARLTTRLVQNMHLFSLNMCALML
jgi:hypothetical protein